MNVPLLIFFTVLTVLIALGIGLLFRSMLVRRLKQTVLDNWIIQSLGIAVIIPVLILAIPILFVIWDNNLFNNFWQPILKQIYMHDLPALIWNIVVTLLIIVLGVGIARTLTRLTVRALGEHRLDINTRTLLGRIFYIIVIILVVFWIFSVWNVQIGVPVAALGVITLVVTVAVQDILKDLFAGFYILMERPFHIGDQITTSNYTGKVEDVQIRATKLRLVSGEEVTIPNSLVFGGTVINNTFYEERRATITITLAQDDFVKDETPQQMLKTIKEVDTVKVKPEPTVTLSGFTGAVTGYTGSFSGYTAKTVTLTARFWIESGQLSTVAEVMYALRTAFPTADLAVRESAGDI
jgi:small conductance mechanosensitive channel